MNMKTVKVSELSGAALNWAVAKCLEVPVIIKDGRVLDAVLLEMQADGSLELDYATDWAQGGPIIGREMACNAGRMLIKDETWATEAFPRFSAEYTGSHWEQSRKMYGPTPLIAAMRCLVVSKLGDTVEIPEELLK